MNEPRCPEHGTIVSDGQCEAINEEHALDFWQLCETPPAYASSVAHLAHWSTNYEGGHTPFLLFCDLIGYSADNFGSALYSASHGDYGLGHVEAGLLAAALVEWADRPGDVVDFVSLLMSAES